MGKTYKLNKSELTRMKQEEKIYLQFLPVLKLKQEQLQIEQIRTRKEYLLLEDDYNNLIAKSLKYSRFLPDRSNPYNLEQLLTPDKISIIKKSVAGVYIPVLEHVSFQGWAINFFDAPCWLAMVSDDLKALVIKNIKIQIIKKQYELISKELKKATQKVNLFEKVLIPETKSAIKRINIVLGDEQVAAVGRAKTAKNKTAGVM
jgi:V/A-type H+-transporting ATPase subunit D